MKPKRNRIFSSRMADVIEAGIFAGKLLILGCLLGALMIAHCAINEAKAVPLSESWTGDDYSIDRMMPTRITILTGEDIDEGKYITIFNHETGTDSDVTILSIEGNIIEVYDYGTGVYRTLTMD